MLQNMVLNFTGIPSIGKINLSGVLNADKYMANTKIEPGKVEIKFDEQIEKEISLKKNFKFISFRARIYYEIEAGAAFLLKIKINDTRLSY